MFVYGSLMHPEVLTRVMGRTATMQPAQLPGFRRGPVRGESFPGVVPAIGRQVSGQLVKGVEASELARLDAFEDDFYIREPHIILTEDRERQTADVYVVHPEYQHLVDAADWDYEAFVAQDLQAFIARYLVTA